MEKKDKHAAAMQNAADEARKDERRMVINYLYATMHSDLAKEIENEEHLKFDPMDLYE